MTTRCSSSQQQGLHDILPALHRSGRLHQQGTMFPSGATSSAVGYDNVLHHPLMFLIKTLLVSMIYMMFPLLVNIIHMMLLFIWIKQYVDVIMIMLMMFLFFFNKHLITTVMIMIMSFSWIKLNLKLPIFLTIQKRYGGQFSSVGFAGLLKPSPFEGTHYKRWRQKSILWLTSMNCFHVVHERAVGPQTSEEEHAFQHGDTTCKAALLSIIGDSLVNAYVQLSIGKAMWDALEARYGVSDADFELYVMK
jgi:hypothetical protein